MKVALILALRNINHLHARANNAGGCVERKEG